MEIRRVPERSNYDIWWPRSGRRGFQQVNVLAERVAGSNEKWPAEAIQEINLTVLYGITFSTQSLMRNKRYGVLRKSWTSIFHYLCGMYIARSLHLEQCWSLSCSARRNRRNEHPLRELLSSVFHLSTNRNSEIDFQTSSVISRI